MKQTNRTIKITLGVLLLVLIVLAGVMYYRHREAAMATSEAQNIALIKEVGSLIILPQNENPVIYEIDDPAALIQQQAFFAGSMKGDKLLVYPQNGKAIVYSPSRHLIVNVGPVTAAPEAANSTGTTGTNSANSAAVSQANPVLSTTTIEAITTPTPKTTPKKK